MYQSYTDVVTIVNNLEDTINAREAYNIPNTLDETYLVMASHYLREYLRKTFGVKVQI